MPTFAHDTNVPPTQQAVSVLVHQVETLESQTTHIYVCTIPNSTTDQGVTTTVLAVCALLVFVGFHFGPICEKRQHSRPRAEHSTAGTRWLSKVPPCWVHSFRRPLLQTWSGHQSRACCKPSPVTGSTDYVHALINAQRATLSPAAQSWVCSAPGSPALAPCALTAACARHHHHQWQHHLLRPPGV